MLGIVYLFGKHERELWERANNPRNPFGLTYESLVINPAKISEISLSTETLVSFIYVEDEDVVIRDIVELASMVKPRTLERKLWAHVKSFEQIMTDKETHLIALPDIFTGPKDVVSVIRVLPSQYRPALRRLILLGIDHLRAFLVSGYDKKENRTNFGGWVLQPESPFLALLCSLYHIKPGYPDATIERELYESAGMRQAITRRTMCALANYFAFVYASPLEYLKGLKEEEWHDVELWNRVRSDFLASDSL